MKTHSHECTHTQMNARTLIKMSLMFKSYEMKTQQLTFCPEKCDNILAMTIGIMQQNIAEVCRFLFGCRERTRWKELVNYAHAIRTNENNIFA